MIKECFKRNRIKYKIIYILKVYICDTKGILNLNLINGNFCLYL